MPVPRFDLQLRRAILRRALSIAKTKAPRWIKDQELRHIMTTVRKIDKKTKIPTRVKHYTQLLDEAKSFGVIN